MTARRDTRVARRALLVILLACGVASCGKKGGLRLPEDDEGDDE